MTLAEIIRPQSNQRGIETRFKRIKASDVLGGLNRTSVGLKLCVGLRAPQHGQRASIEPAWD